MSPMSHFQKLCVKHEGEKENVNESSEEKIKGAKRISYHT